MNVMKTFLYYFCDAYWGSKIHL